MKIIIEGEPKEISDLAMELQNQLSPEELKSRLESHQGELKKILENRITEELSQANRDKV